MSSHGKEDSLRSVQVKPKGTVAACMGTMPKSLKRKESGKLVSSSAEDNRKAKLMKATTQAAMLKPNQAAIASQNQEHTRYGSPTDGDAGAASGSAQPPSPQPLYGSTWAERNQERNWIRAQARMKKLPVPRTFRANGLVEPPLPCNRIAVPWGKQPGPCHCKEEWPKFCARALRSGQARRIHAGRVECYDGFLTIRPGEIPRLSYRRPGKRGEKWWYDGLLAQVLEVTDKSGHKRKIAVVN